MELSLQLLAVVVRSGLEQSCEVLEGGVDFVDVVDCELHAHEHLPEVVRYVEGVRQAAYVPGRDECANCSHAAARLERRHQLDLVDFVALRVRRQRQDTEHRADDFISDGCEHLAPEAAAVDCVLAEEQHLPLVRVEDSEAHELRKERHFLAAFEEAEREESVERNEYLVVICE